MVRKLVLISLITTMGCSCGRKPVVIYKSIFRDHPKSLTVLNAQDQFPSDCCIWLHFTIDGDHFEDLFKEYEIRKLNYSKWENLIPPEVDWWHPSKFKENGTYYEKWSQDQTKCEAFYTNHSKTEFFYVNANF